MSITLTGRVSDITTMSPADVQLSVKAPYPRPSGDGDIVTTSPTPVTVGVNGTFTITVDEGVGWLYASSEGWSDTVRFVAAAGMTTVWQAVVNALPTSSGVKQYLQAITDAKDAVRAELLKALDTVDDAVNASVSEFQEALDKRPTLGQATAIAFGAASAMADSSVQGAVSVGQATSIAFGAASVMADNVPQPPVVDGDGNLTWAATKPVYLWGDSQIDRGDPGTRIADALSTSLYQPVVDNAIGGMPIDDSLFRAGGIHYYGIPVTGVIPSDMTPVEVDMLGMVASLAHTVDIPVTWAGVPGSLHVEHGRFTDSGNQELTFTRYEPGEQVTITTPERLIPNVEFDPYATHIVISGGNDWSKGFIPTSPETDKTSHLINSYSRWVEMSKEAPVKHILIGGVKTRSTTMPGDSAHVFVQDVNNHLRDAFPHLFVDRQRWLCERGPEVLNLTLTDDEKIQQEAGIIPAGVFFDETHFGPEVRAAEAQELWVPHLGTRGWGHVRKL